jgi:hypothetical protein
MPEPKKDCFIEHYDGFVKRTHTEKPSLEIIGAGIHFAGDYHGDHCYGSDKE